uniref:NIDO domain-containing protein n=1 Tax=Clytia hemisphaerica TaxID=252671 RepID=A0A7M5WRE4_9CNID
MIDKDILLSKSVPSFKSKEAIVITFNNVPYYDKRNILFRFQVVIATDYKNTYTIFNYDRIDNPGYGNIGYAEPDGEVSCTPYKSFNLNGNTLSTSSNVGKPGKFVFLLTNCTNDREFIPYGQSYGDRFANEGDSSSTCFSSFSKRFPLFSTANRSQVCINSNGFITVDNSNTDTRASLTSYYSVLVPFNYDLKSYGRDILYRSTTQQNILSMIDKDILLSKSVPSFKSKEAIVITFNNVPYYDKRNILFRFQVVMATDYKNTYTIFNYDRIDNPGYGNIGYAEPDGEVSCTPYKSFNLNGNTLTTSSNVGKPGKFVFLLTNCTNDKEFIPYGQSYGDSFANEGDSSSTCFSSFSKRFPLFSTTNRSQVCISSNGYITVDQSVTDTKASLTSYYSVLVPFNFDMKSRGKDILYRSTTDQNTLMLIDRNIGLLHSQKNTTSSFKSKEAIIVTFNNVPYYNNRNMIFRYQVVIATDYKNTYSPAAIQDHPYN